MVSLLFTSISVDLLGFDNVLLVADGSVLLCGDDVPLGADGGNVLLGANGSALLCDGNILCFGTIHTIELVAGIPRASSLSTSSIFSTGVKTRVRSQLSAEVCAFSHNSRLERL